MDSDGDGLNDRFELNYGPAPLEANPEAAGEDWDDDGLSNLEEQEHGTNPYSNDTDGDGLTDADEVRLHHTDPTRVDSDGDWLNDGEELDNQADPSKADTDGDGLTDYQEVRQYGTRPDKRDSDDDGMDDPFEIEYGMDGTSPDGDEDGDGLSNVEEFRLGTHPRMLDGDGDGLPDKLEIELGLSPVKYDSDGGGRGDGDELFADGTDPENRDDDRMLLGSTESPSMEMEAGLIATLEQNGRVRLTRTDNFSNIGVEYALEFGARQPARSGGDAGAGCSDPDPAPCLQPHERRADLALPAEGAGRRPAAQPRVLRTGHGAWILRVLDRYYNVSGQARTITPVLNSSPLYWGQPPADVQRR